MNASDILILNVDDNDGARYAKTRILQVAGFKVIEAENGADALSMVLDRLPDLVLLDVKLPDINGIEVCRRIKETPATSMVMVLQTSAALTGRADKIRGLEGGADNYLAAPIEADELIANVNALLRLRKTQVDLKESEERFRQMAESIKDVFWIFSVPDQTMLYVSPAYEAMWQRSSAVLCESPDDWLDVIHPDDRERVRSSFQAKFQNQHYHEDFRIVRSDGSVRWMRDRAFPVKNANHEVYRMARITSDITDAKSAEKALQDADIHKDQFLATLAHELRNPLGPIRNAVELMRHADPVASEMHAQAGEVISRQVDHMARLVDDLLDIARISKGKIRLEKNPVELNTFIQSAIETTLPFINIRNHALNVSLLDEKTWMAGDSVRLAQIIANLLNNAAKYTPRSGEISLSVELLPANRAKIIVRDNGIGIPFDQLHTIFDLFSQGDAAPDRAQDGLGIGLSLVKKLVELHHGVIHAESPGQGGGSAFHVDFPILQMESPVAPDDAAAGPGATAAGTALTVLVVDDNIDSAHTTSMLLNAYGYKTYMAHDAISTMAIARQHAPDVILLDIGLPVTNGYDVARMLRKQPQFQKIKLIAVTGYGAERDRQKAIDAGFDHHLVKPANIAKLLEFLSAPG